MRKLPLLAAMALLSATLFMGGCDTMQMDHKHTSMWASVTRAVAVLKPTGSNTASGVITFAQMGDHVHVTGTITGLAPNSSHGFHIHEFGDINSADGMSTGGHYNPEGAAHQHGELNGPASHAGDMGNVIADSTGAIKIDLMVHGISIAGLHDPIVGRGLVLHGNPDDLKSQPAGNAGPRVAVGVIGVAK